MHLQSFMYLPLTIDLIIFFLIFSISTLCPLFIFLLFLFYCAADVSNNSDAQVAHFENLLFPRNVLVSNRTQKTYQPYPNCANQHHATFSFLS